MAARGRSRLICSHRPARCGRRAMQGAAPTHRHRLGAEACCLQTSSLVYQHTQLQLIHGSAGLDPLAAHQARRAAGRQPGRAAAVPAPAHAVHRLHLVCARSAARGRVCEWSGTSRSRMHARVRSAGTSHRRARHPETPDPGARRARAQTSARTRQARGAEVGGVALHHLAAEQAALGLDLGRAAQRQGQPLQPPACGRRRGRPEHRAGERACE